MGVTAIDKRPVDGPVKVHKLGLHGDIQASRIHHGGEDQALYAYSQADADYWTGELRPRAAAGDLRRKPPRWQGSTPRAPSSVNAGRIGLDVEVEVTSPRVPCATFQRRMDEAQWVKRFTEEGRVGAYLRVIKTGPCRPATTSTASSFRSHGVTIGRWFSEPDVDAMEALRDAEADGEIRLQPEYHERFEKLLRRVDREYAG